jgi:hypothetical protein
MTIFILLAKSVTAVMKVLYPWISLLFHSVELALFAFSIHGQTAPDTIDKDHQNPGLPWYITKSCSVTRRESNKGYCLQAKVSFYMTVFFM